MHLNFILKKKRLVRNWVSVGWNEAGNCRALINWVLRSTSSLSTRITPRTRCAYLRVITCPTKYENMVALVAIRFHTLYVLLSVRLWFLWGWVIKTKIFVRKVTKGQMSKGIYEIINFSGHFLENWWFHKSILT